MYQFDTQNYYHNTERNLLIAANSAANPILYFWRMPALKEYTLSCIRKISRLIRLREVTRPANNVHQVEEECENRVIQNINVIPNPQAAATGDTEF